MTAFASRCRTRLVAAFKRSQCIARPEVPLFDQPLPDEYSPKCDLRVELEREKTKHVIWIELEYRRADPVANPAKFAVAFRERNPVGEKHWYVSALSKGIQAGRAKLCKSFIEMCNTIKLPVRFDWVDFLPDFTEAEICKLSRLPGDQLDLQLGEGLSHRLDPQLDRLVSDVLAKLPPT